ncbi:MAG TPA: bile acid:sodium symporter family protein [Magnetospirillaceae bacterium]|jgi:sodium/bile acid cotransporter 7
MSILHQLERFGVDRFTMALVTTVVTASILPASGVSATYLKYLTDLAIGVMFFMYGARLPREVVVQGIAHWRLHVLVFACTFLVFPLLGLATHVLVPKLMSPDVYIGIVFLCCLPSTVQSSIAFTSIARGNVAAAICSASASNLIGILVTPVLAGVLLSAHGGFSPHAILAIAVQLLLPFVAGQLARPWLGKWALRNKRLLSYTDRGSILLVVYGAFSEAVIGGIWHQLPAQDFAVIVGVNAALLAAVLATTTFVSRAFGFNKEDEIAIVFCGSKKSLASGVPMASVIFAGHPIGLIVLPLMLFHQIQLMVCAILARRYAANRQAPVPSHA